jgi:hypothetical protein
MVDPRMFQPKDYSQIERWGCARDVAPPPIGLLSDLGLIVDDVAAGFLYITNSDICFLEGFITNPEADKNDRHEALNGITLELINLAKEAGCKLIKCDTRLDKIVTRAKDFGFVELGQYKTFIREL